jgi:hypothetical protein
MKHFLSAITLVIAVVSAIAADPKPSHAEHFVVVLPSSLA